MDEGRACDVPVSDSVYLLQTARETYTPGGVLDAGWAVARTLMAFAAWRPAARVEGKERESWGTIVMPIGFALVALPVEVYDHFQRVNVLTLILATARLAAVLTRLALTFVQNLRMLATSRAEATTDVLTGLGNRRLLERDLERAEHRIADGERILMVLFDLNGFKQHNDSFGHPAGDALLVGLGDNLRRAARGAAWIAFRRWQQQRLSYETQSLRHRAHEKLIRAFLDTARRCATRSAGRGRSELVGERRDRLSYASTRQRSVASL